MTIRGQEGTEVVNQATSRVGTGWRETYLGGSPEAEQALFAAAYPRVQEIQETVAKTRRRVERSEALSPFNTPCLRPLGRTNRGRIEAYRRSASRRGASSALGPTSGSMQL